MNYARPHRRKRETPRAQRRFSQSYVEELQRKVAASEQAEQHLDRSSAQPAGLTQDSTDPRSNVFGDTGSDLPGGVSRRRSLSAQSQDLASDSSQHLINNLATGQTVYVPDVTGKAIYLGTSSSWSFGRRVLILAQERIMKVPLSPNHLLWEGRAYDLGWDGYRNSASSSTDNSPVIPESDFGMFLLNAVKFHVGQLFHLFDETEFMDNFAKFYERKSDAPALTSLWYSHYLLILAFGKAFTVRTRTPDRRPPGCQFFAKAMQVLPDPSFAELDTFGVIEVLCCAALYLHSLDFRGAAYNFIGQALRIALQNGFHTDMSNSNIPEPRVERARRIWWTVLLLDRQMSSLMGLPPAIGDDHITACLPTYHGSTFKIQALDLHIKLSSVMFTIVSNVYGKEGRINSKFLIHTKAALKGVADVTNQLNEKFGLPSDAELVGISRVSAYLHILHHQCVVMATRPLLFSYFDARLSLAHQHVRSMRPSKSIRTLMQMCKDSAMRMLRILSSLQNQGLLESFLSFDVDAVYNSALVLRMGAHIDTPLLDDESTGLDTAYHCFDEMIACGNRCAETMKLELQRLQDILGRLPQRPERPNASQQSTNAVLGADQPIPTHNGTDSTLSDLTAFTSPMDLPNSTANWFYGSGPTIQEGFNAEQMMMVADSIDLDGIDWWFNRTDGMGIPLD